MLTRDEIDGLVAESIARLGVGLDAKPVVYGGLAMEFYALREHGSDIDLLVSERDLAALWARFPDRRKDMWGDLGVSLNGMELFRSVYRLEAGFYAEGAAELTSCRVVSAERLLFMKWLAQGLLPKNDRDLALLRGFFLSRQRADWEAYKDARAARYLASPTGALVGDQIDEP